MTGDSCTAAPLLEMRAISKTFSGTRALDRVSFVARPGEIHALVGENGAGKSTLMNIAGGVYPFGTYQGELLAGGVLRRFHGVRSSEEAGIAVVHQELSLVPEFSIAENIFLGREPRRFGIIQREELFRRAQIVLDQLQLRLDPQVPAGQLGIGQQHLVEIAKALARDARILILDEPTAALPVSEVEILCRILASLRARGAAIVYISHKLEEVFRMSDRITVLRDDSTVSSDETSAVTPQLVISRMVGREVPELFPSTHHDPGAVVFEARGVTVEDPNVPEKLLVDDASFQVRQGEIVGIAGMVGAGRSDLMMAVFGAHPGRTAGRFLMDGTEIRIDCPAHAIAAGIGFVTEDRQRFGLLDEKTLVTNMTLASLARFTEFIVPDLDAETAACQKSMHDLRIKAENAFTLAGTLSGGNQQKVVLARWLLTRPRVLLLDEPTRGIDIGAKQEIYQQIRRLAEDGLAIVLVSSELPEVLHLADRVLVLHQGRITGEFIRGDATADAVMSCAAGQRQASASAEKICP